MEKNIVEKKKQELLALLRAEGGMGLPQNRAITPRKEGNTLSLSFAQQRLWFFDQLQPNSPAYNMFHGLRLIGSLSLLACQRSMQEIVSRHEILRTLFVQENGIPHQVILPARQQLLPLIDLRAMPQAQREALARQLTYQEIHQPFNLIDGPLLRTTLLRLSDTEHWLLITCHHIVSDGWSSGILFNELSALYNAFLRGEPSPLPLLPIQYADYAIWQRQWLEGAELQRQISYWKQHLLGSPTVLELPTDRPRPPLQSYRGSTYTFVLPQILTHRLRMLSQQEGVTQFMTLLASFATLLYRYSGQNRLVIGSPIANRTHTEIEGVIGFFVNTLALHIQLPENPTFQRLLAHVREVTLNAYAHQDLPFEKLVEVLHPTRLLSHSPLVQVLFVLQNMPREAPSLAQLQLDFVNMSESTTRFDLVLAITPQGENLKASLTYNSDLFEMSTIRQMGEHFQRILESVVANLARRLNDLALLSEAEIEQQLIAWQPAGGNAMQQDYPEAVCLHQLFEAQVEHIPDEIAVTFEDQTLTYNELNLRANQLAHALQALGVKPDVMVGMCLERSLEMIIALLAVHKAGGAYVPLDPAYPQERLASMVDDSQVSILLTQTSLVEHLPSKEVVLMCLDTYWQTERSKPTENPCSGVQPDNSICMIYTSGSTGKPKGVMNTHRGVSNYVQWMQKECHLSIKDRVLQKAPFSFDASIWEFFWPLIAGAHLIIARPDGHRDASYLVSLIEEQQVTTLHFVPSMLHVFLLESDLETRCRSLKRVFCGGEALMFDMQERFFKRFAHTSLYNRYGPTEAAIAVAYWECRRGSFETTIPIGRPIANIQLYILDKAMQPVPIGVPGELYIGGVGVARGYFNRPELTAEKFICDPFSGRKGARLFRTGDLSRYLPDGTIEFLGRNDTQVKLRGFRLELGEVEAVLISSPAIQQAVCIVRKDHANDQRLFAYIVTDQDHKHEHLEKILRQYLHEHLPAYMIPQHFVFLDALPLTPNGKLDRQALPTPEWTHSVREKYVAPQTTLEAQIATIWQDLLRIDKVGIYDNFFELGGHSLLAAHATNKLQKICPVNVSLVQFFSASTLAELAQMIEQASQTIGKGKKASPTIEPSPLFPLQETTGSLVAIQPSGSKSPFFCVHEASGNVLSFYHVASYLPKDQPFYGFQSRGIDGKHEPFTKIEDMASYYLELLSTVQPEGPYFLGGWSMGATVALDMAQRLQKQGQQVALLVSFDGWGARFEHEALENSPALDDASLTADFAQDYDLPVLQDKFLSLAQEEQVHYLMQQAKKVGLLSTGAEVSQIRRLLHVYKSNVRAAKSYRIREVYQGNFVLLRASEPHSKGLKDPTKGWSRILPQEVKIQDIPGNHHTIFRAPHVQLLAERLHAIIASCP
jgi:amino acid adenylation domain-containing protein